MMLLFLASLAAILALTGLAWALGFRTRPALDEADARAEAEGRLAGFRTAEVAMATDGHGAVLKGRDGSIALLLPLGDGWVARRAGLLWQPVGAAGPHQPREPERDEDRPRYGIVKALPTLNPLWAAVHEWVAIAREAAAARSMRELGGRLFGPPGWQPDGDGETSEGIRARWQAAQTGES